MMFALDTYTFSNIEFPVDPKPNLITGVGHGHFRPLRRHKVAANITKKQKKARKMTKRSRRRNRRAD